jgi:hypothetical protein
MKLMSGTKYLIITLVALCSILSYTGETQSADISPFKVRLKGRVLQDTTIGEYLTDVGGEGHIPVAIQDRMILCFGVRTEELTAANVTVDLKDGSFQEQLSTISEHIPILGWSESHGVAWIINKKTTEKSPLESVVTNFVYKGTTGKLGIQLHKFDERIPDVYSYIAGHEDKKNTAASEVNLLSGRVRDVFSLLLQKTAKKGPLLLFKEMIPRDVGDSAVPTNSPDYTNKFYSYEMLQDISDDSRNGAN